MANKVRAVKSYLEAKAAAGITTTYEDIALSLRMPSSGNALGAALSPILCEIFLECREAGHPPITSIVVRKSGQDVGLPGQGFWSLMPELNPDHLDREAKRVLTQNFQRRVFEQYQ